MEEEKKIGFFKRVKKAIFNLEDYKIFANEKFSKAFKYFVLLIFVITLVLAVSSTIRIRQELDKLISYVKEELPDFSYSDEKLTLDERVNSYDEEYDAKLIIDTSEEIADEQVEEYKSEAKESYYSFILLRDKVYYDMDGYEYEVTYNQIANLLGVSTLTKQELVDNYLDNNSILKITAVIFIYSIIVLFVSNFLTLLEDVLVILIFAWLTTKICRVNLSMKSIGSISIYSVTLSLILSTVYSIIYTFTNFEIKYFSLMYMIIAYIYVVASILMMKEDVNNGVGQEMPIIEEKKEKEEKEIKEEPKEKEKKEEDKKDKKEKEKDKEDKGNVSGEEA